MGTPIESLIDTHFLIDEVRISRERKVVRRNYRNPDAIIPKKTEKVLRKRDFTLHGKATNLPRYHYVAALLLKNEIYACIQQAMDKEGLLRNFRKEYTSMSPKECRKLFDKLSKFRYRYNKGRLYAAQQMPPLYAFAWNKRGYIRHQTNSTMLVGFEYCKRILKQARFIDPRFFDEHERSVYRRDEDGDYHVPLQIEIETIEAEIKKPLYNSIEFPEGYGKGHHTI